MKSGKKRKRIIILASIVTVLACAAVYILVLGSPRPAFIQVSSPVDNAHRNRSANISAEAVGENGRLLFNAYTHSLIGGDGIEQLDGGWIRCIYRSGFGYFGGGVPFSDYMYNGKLIERAENAILSLNLSNGQFEPFFYPALKKGEVVVDVFTSGGELYYSTGSEDVYSPGSSESDGVVTLLQPDETADPSVTIYHYIDDHTVETAASEELCGKGFTPYDFCGDTMYYYREGSDVDHRIPNDFGAEEYDCGFRTLYVYDLTERKTERCIDFSCIDSVLPKKNSVVDNVLVTDHKVYLFVRILESLDAHYSKEVIEGDPIRQEIGYAERLFVYRYDIDSGKLEDPVEVGDSSPFNVNGYGDKVYVQAHTEQHSENEIHYQSTLYAFSDSADRPTVLHTSDKLWGLYIFDEEYLYYNTTDYHLYRIRPDDTGNERVF